MAESQDPSVSRRTTGLLSLAALGPPAAWLVQVTIAWGAEEWICRTASGQRSTFTVIALLLSAAALAVAVASGLASLKRRRAARDRRAAEHDDTVPESRDSFFASVGVGSAVLFGILIVVTALPLVFLEPCTP